MQQTQSVQVANTSVLDAEKKKLQDLWLSRESSLAHRITPAQRSCLPAPSCCTRILYATDGFARRQCALLSDDALTLAFQLFECMETLGTNPQQLRCVLVRLIPTATTGCRTVGIFCALYQLWAKCRTATAQAWENLHPRPHFAASKGRAVTDPIWRHAAVVACGVGLGEETVSVCTLL